MPADSGQWQHHAAIGKYLFVTGSRGDENANLKLILSYKLRITSEDLLFY